MGDRFFEKDHQKECVERLIKSIEEGEKEKMDDSLKIEKTPEEQIKIIDDLTLELGRIENLKKQGKWEERKRVLPTKKTPWQKVKERLFKD